MGRLKLFDDDGDSPNDDISKIETDENFAKRLEHNKKREELQRYEELKKQGLVESFDSDDSSSSEEEELPSKIADPKFFDALIKVKNKDPILRDEGAKLFNSDSEEEDNSGNGSEKEGKKKKKKAMYLKDVVSKHLIEEGPEFDDEEMENGDNDEMQNRVKTYSEEQEELRRGVLEAMEDEDKDEEGDLFKVKDDGSLEEDEEEDDIKEKLDDYFGEDEELDENTLFLKDYFRNKMWIDDGKKSAGGSDIELSEDEEEIEKQEEYEREFNFRFEENAGDRVMGHSRKVEGSVRKKDNTRKLQRERKEERMAQAEFERKEELKRLKNLKKKEIKEKLEKIREAAGIGHDRNIVLDEDDLEEEFNPEEHDKKMKAAFGDDYYEAEDANPEFGSDAYEDELEKPDFDMEDKLLGLRKGWDEANMSGDESEEGEGEREKEASEVEKAAREKLMEEYYKLDYEGTIGDLKTRFKYKEVKPRRYGLSPAELLKLDDKDLNQYISLKKLAPYREKDWKVPRIKTVNFKKTVLHNRRTSHSKKTGLSINKSKKKTGYDGKTTSEKVNAEETEKLRPSELNDDIETSSKRGKRKRQQGEFQLSEARLKAYGKAPSKPKSKSKKS